jgi:hypothetical protein
MAAVIGPVVWHGAASDIKEDGLALALQPDVEPDLAFGLGRFRWRSAVEW